MAGILSFRGKLAGGSNASPSLLVDTFITRCAVIEEKGAMSLAKTKSCIVDGFDSETSTIYQFYGCKWHGCPCLRIANNKYGT